MSSSALARLLLLVVSLALGACTTGSETPDGGGTPGGDGAVTPPGDLRIEPLDHMATIAGAPVSVDYRAYLRDASGSEREVTSEVTWSATMNGLGTFAGATFTSGTDLGGQTTIRATLGDDVATTTLTLRLERVIVTEGTPSDAPTRFSGTPDASRAPSVVYPEDGAMVPPNLRELELHFAPNGGTLFELHLTAPTVDLRVYFTCAEPVTGGCIYAPDDAVWDPIASAGRGQGPITYRLRAVDDAGVVGESEARTLIVAEEDITGGLYYWNAGAGTIMRFEFGVRGALPERFLDQGRAGASTCVGCHTLSRDGTRIAIGTDIPTTTFQVFDVATRSRIFSLGGGGGFPGLPAQPNFATFSPDNAQIATSALSGLAIRDAANGNVVTENLGGGAASMPDWSPDGDRIVYVAHEAPPTGGFGLEDVPGVSSGSIHTLERDGAGWREGPVLVARASENNFYPAYSPDGAWVVFNRSPSNANSMGEDSSGGMAGVRDAELWVVSASGGTPIRLERAAGLTDSWPKWDPTEYLDRGAPLYWLAWSSRRAYGLRYGDDARVQLWMAAFDPALAASGMDPVHPAFRLPFQDIESGNHIAQWVTTVERQTCTTNADCGGEFCVDGRCFEEEPLF